MFVDITKVLWKCVTLEIPRLIPAQKADQIAKNKGFEKTYWGPELEFFRIQQNNIVAISYVSSKLLWWDWIFY